MKNILALSLFFLLYSFTGNAQTDASWKIYDDSQLVRVDITIDSTTLKWIYANPHSDSEHYAQFHFKNAWIDETVDSIGFRLRGNTSRDSQKKSFKVSFNSFIKGRQFYGIEKLNLNGEHNDPSIIRSKLCFDLFHDAGITASHANHAKVYINGKYYGLYVNVEHIDEEFLKKNFLDDSGNLWKCLYPADLTYLGSDPNLYKAVMNNPTTRAYELSTNKTKDDYTKLSNLISILSNTSSAAFPDSIEKYLDVRRVLQYFAMNTLLGSWDDYRSLMNNYYLYHNPSTNKFTLIPYDYDNTFGIDWFDINWSVADPYNYPKAVQGERPMAEKLLANDQYRDLYTHFVEFYKNNIYQLSLWEHRIDTIKSSIVDGVTEDTYRTLDYGFTMNDFNNSFSMTSYSNKHVKFGLKQFVNLRNESIAGQLNFKNALPMAYTIDYSPRNPLPNDSILVMASCFGKAGLKEVNICFTQDGTAVAETLAMFFSPIENSKRVEEADRWIGTIPALGAGKSGAFTIMIKDSSEQVTSYPRVVPIHLSSSSLPTSSIVINEFLADNTIFPDPSGEFDDWIELFNPTTVPIRLTNKYLTDKSTNLLKWKFTQSNLELSPGTFLLVWCDEDTGQAGIHTNFKLSAGGEFLALTDSDGVTVLDSLSFGQQTANIAYGRMPDGSENWKFITPTPGEKNVIYEGVTHNEKIPIGYALDVYPNPFNPSTTIRFTIQSSGLTTLKIFDMLGKEIAILVNEYCQAGSHSVRFPGSNVTKKNSTLSGFSSGVYFVQLQSNGKQALKKIVLLK